MQYHLSSLYHLPVPGMRETLKSYHVFRGSACKYMTKSEKHSGVENKFLHAGIVIGMMDGRHTLCVPASLSHIADPPTN